MKWVGYQLLWSQTLGIFAIPTFTYQNQVSCAWEGSDCEIEGNSTLPNSQLVSHTHIYIWSFLTITRTITVILFTVPLLLGEQFHANCGWLWQATNDHSNCKGVFTNQSGYTHRSLVNSGHERVADQSLGLSHSTFSNWFLSGCYQPPATTLMNTSPLESLFGVNFDALFWTEEFQSYFRPACRIKWLALYQK